MKMNNKSSSTTKKTATKKSASKSSSSKDSGTKSNLNTTDVSFLTGMIPHHESAIKDAKKEIAKGSNPEAKKIARGILATQQKEITRMKKIVDKAPPAAKKAAKKSSGGMSGMSGMKH